jgi:hypothetical protein
MKKSLKKSLYVLIPVVCAVVGLVVYNSYVSSRVVLKDELGTHRKLLHNAETEHACDCYSPFITNFAVSNIKATSADITWDCDAPSSYQVRWGTAANPNTMFPTSTPTTPYKHYTVTLTGLKTGTTYHVGPSSICLNSCTRNEVTGVNGKRRQTDRSGKSDWTFNTGTAVINPPEIKAVYNSIFAVKVSEITAKEVTINWTTTNPATSLIEYGATTTYGMKSEQNLIAEKNHAIQLFDLALGTTYHARAISNDPATGKAVYSADFTFTTPVAETRVVNAAAVFNEPNPAFSRTVFSYYLYKPIKRMTIDIVTLSGKMVATLEAPQSTLGEGHNKVMWDLRDNSQRRVANGLYAYKMKFFTADNQVQEVAKSNLMVRN